MFVLRRIGDVLLCFWYLGIVYEILRSDVKSVNMQIEFRQKKEKKSATTRHSAPVLASNVLVHLAHLPAPRPPSDPAQ
jgi:hypothetical protein